MVDIRSLHPLEIKVLLNVAKDEIFDDNTIIERCSFNTGWCNQAFSWLIAKKLIEQKDVKSVFFYEITDIGRNVLFSGFTEERMISALKEKSLSLQELQQVLNEEQKNIGSAFAVLKKEGCVSVSEDKKLTLVKSELPEIYKMYKSLLESAKDSPLSSVSLDNVQLDAIEKISKKRSSDNLFRKCEKLFYSYVITDDGLEVKKALLDSNITGDEITLLTREMMKSGEWREKNFREYDVEHIPVSKLLSGKSNPYTDYIRLIKDKLVAMGFEEFDGSLVENDFWNADALFMPQFHPARDIHDVYYIESPSVSHPIEEPYISNVAQAHEKGWQYKFDRNFSRRLLLRSQGTVLSAHQLTKAKIPGRYFGIVRCFRYDQVDATHGADFYQTEGIVLGNDVNFKTLLSLLEMFAKEIAGAKEVKYVPGYFPFTEPSVEIHIKHPKLGWFELGGSGIFRTEVTKPLGIDVPVLAWGLGIDRMALMGLGLSDIRDLFTKNLDKIRLSRSKNA